MELTARITLAVTVLLVAALVHLVARVRTPGRLFLIALGRDLTPDDHARARRVMTVNALFAVAGVAIALVARQGWMLALVASALPLVPIGWMLAEMGLLVRTLPPPSAPGRWLVPLDQPPPVTAYISAPLQIANVAAVLLGAACFAAVRSTLPARIPMQFDARGRIARHGSPDELWAMFATEVFLLGLLWVITFAVARERWALPAENAERYAAAQRRRRSLMVRMLETMFLGLNLSFTVIVLAIALGGDPARRWVLTTGVIAGVVLSAAATLGGIAGFMPALVRVQDELRQLSGSEVLGTHASGWRWGGIIYYAPGDPAVFVPKSMGIGQTINFARPAAWAFLLAVVVVPLVLTLLGLMLAR